MSYRYCGSPRGFDDHRKDNEPPCKWCLKAVTAPAPAPVEEPRPAQCGSESGAKRHRRRGEPVCAECKAAVAAAARKRKAKTRPFGWEPSRVAKCPSPAMYQKHKRLGEDCEPCRLAANERRRKYNKPKATA